MEIEYEATFTDINKDEIRNELKNVGANLERSEYTQKRTVFNLPAGNEVRGGYARIRDEGDKITMSLKIIDGDGIEDQREACVTVDSYEQAEILLINLGCTPKAEQETKRELWTIDNVEVTIDTWPFLEPFIEVEGASEEAVKSVSEKLGMDWTQAVFGAVDVIYNQKYGVPCEDINNNTPKIIFDMDNPFLNR